MVAGAFIDLIHDLDLTVALDSAMLECVRRDAPALAARL